MPPQNFDPYPDWEKVTDEHAKKLGNAVAEYRRASVQISDLATPQSAARFMQAHHDVGVIHDEILEDIWTVPMMVHVAAERDYEEIEEQTVMVQRCARCKSILHIVHEGIVLMGPNGPEWMTEENTPWWAPGQLVAKATRPDSMSMYLIEDRELEKHEMECVGLPNMEG
jgi:hypothetical protein